MALRIGDGTCWGWTPESYLHHWRHPQWPLPAEPLRISARVLADGRDYTQDFLLDASSEVFAVQAASKVLALPGISAASHEVSAFARMRVIPGGR